MAKFFWENNAINTPVTVTNPDFASNPPLKVGDIIVVNGETMVIEDAEHTSYLGINAQTGRSNSDHLNVANTPKEKKEHTSGRREDRRRYAYAPIDGKPIDTVRHPRIRGCGHSFVVGHVPQHRNCKSCWNALFINDAQLAERIAQGIQQLGPEEVSKLLGKKLLTNFLRFITIVAEMEKWKRNHEPGESEGSGGSEGAQPDDQGQGNTD